MQLARLHHCVFKYTLLSMHENFYIRLEFLLTDGGTCKC